MCETRPPKDLRRPFCITTARNIAVHGKTGAAPREIRERVTSDSRCWLQLFLIHPEGRSPEYRRKGEDPLDPATSSSSVVMICPNLKCRRVLQVPGKFRGQHVKCRYCSLTFAVPLAKAAVRSADIAEEARNPKEQEGKKGDAGKKK
jgi:hypothetical protein